jgi:hypothetical protein
MIILPSLINDTVAMSTAIAEIIAIAKTQAVSRLHYTPVTGAIPSEEEFVYILGKVNVSNCTLETASRIAQFTSYMPMTTHVAAVRAYFTAIVSMHDAHRIRGWGAPPNLLGNPLAC